MNKVLCGQCQRFCNECDAQDKTHLCPSCVRSNAERDALDHEDGLRLWIHEKGTAKECYLKAKENALAKHH